MSRPPVCHLCLIAVSLVGALALAACNPALNWREVRSAESPLVALMPCKPEASSRSISLGGQNVTVHLNSCRASDATFAVASTRLPVAAQVPLAQVHWRSATLANLSLPASSSAAGAVSETGVSVAGVAGAQTLVQASGRRPGGGDVAFAGLWFAKGADLFHAGIYADRLSQDMREPFFSGLAVQ